MRPTPTNPSTWSLMSPLNKRIRHALRGGDPHALHLQILLDHLLPALASEARSLVAAEGRQITHGAIGVDPHRSRLELLGHLERPAHALGPHAGRKTIHHVVANRDCLVVVLER